MSHSSPLVASSNSADNLRMARAKLGFAFTELSGAVGRNVIVPGREGFYVRRKPSYRYASKPAVVQGSQRLTQANTLWNDLSLPEVEAWRRYALTVVHRDPVSGKQYSPTAKNVFVALATKLLQMDPSGEVSRFPPSGEFVGDALLVSVSAGASGLVFTASGSNSAGVVTELLVQKLVNIRRSPTSFYKSAAFVSFSGLPVELSFEPGVYACAYRFVESATGRMTGVWTLGVVEV